MFLIKFKNSLIALFSFGALALFAPTPAYCQLLGPQKVVVTNTTSNPVPTVAPTHLGRKASEMVSLSGLFDIEGEIFFLRSLPDGNATSFTIPPGKVFIITDVNWQIEAGNPGTVARLRLRTENLANPTLIRNVFDSVLTLNSAGLNGSNESLGTGIVVSSGAKITAQLTTPTGALGSLFLIGYLAPEE
jgi:hypothetical protein